jgi:hypothetical protein
MQSLFTLVFVAVRFIKLKNPGPLSYALLGYMASSSLGYTLRADYVAARAGGFFLFFSCVAFISLLLWNRLNFMGAVMELKSNLPLYLPLLACLALVRSCGPDWIARFSLVFPVRLTPFYCL